GNFSYSPPAGYTGTQTFTYRVSDGIASSTATVSLDITNTAPVAHNDVYSVHSQQTLTTGHASGDIQGVWQNDSDADNDPLSFELLNDAAGGEVALQSNGDFAYQPDAAFIGDDSFTYRVFDGVAHSSAATVTIHVWDDPPNANNDEYFFST